MPRTANMIMSHTVSLLLLVTTVNICTGVPIDNELTDTSVSCDQDRIHISIETRKPFLGRIFAKSMSRNADCYKEFLSNSTIGGSLSVELTKCGMNRERKLSPEPGIMESLTIIVSFHYLFITKVDRALSIECFYSQQKRNHAVTFAKEIRVSEIPTEAVTAEIQKPSTCQYMVHLGSETGPEARFVQVGDKLFHHWICEGPEDLKILVKDCLVTDGDSEQFLVVDSNGCAVDPVIVADPGYTTDGKSALVESHAFKFADTSFIGFHCTVELCAPSRGDQQCEERIPPKCVPDGVAVQETFTDGINEIETESTNEAVFELTPGGIPTAGVTRRPAPTPWVTYRPAPTPGLTYRPAPTPREPTATPGLTHRPAPTPHSPARTTVAADSGYGGTVWFGGGGPTQPPALRNGAPSVRPSSPSPLDDSEYIPRRRVNDPLPVLQWPYQVKFLRDEVDVSSGPMNILDPSLNPKQRRLLLSGNEWKGDELDQLQQLNRRSSSAAGDSSGAEVTTESDRRRRTPDVCVSSRVATVLTAALSLFVTLILSVCIVLALKLIANRKTYWWSA